jgi:hypothetical protein
VHVPSETTASIVYVRPAPLHDVHDESHQATMPCSLLHRNQICAVTFAEIRPWYCRSLWHTRHDWSVILFQLLDQNRLGELDCSNTVITTVDINFIAHIFIEYRLSFGLEYRGNVSPKSIKVSFCPKCNDIVNPNGKDK